MSDATANGKPSPLIRTVPPSFVDLSVFLDHEVYPRLDAKTIYSSAKHKWAEELPEKIKGGCPWHESKSGTSFYVDTKSLLWRCPGCQIGGGPVQYRWRLRGRSGSPRGEDFVDVVRELCDLAGVPFPDCGLSLEDQRRAQRRETRRAILETVEATCHALLLLPAGEGARAYLLTRGFDEFAIRDLRLGWYPRCAELKRVLREKGFAEEDVTDSGIIFRKLEGYVIFPWRDENGAPLTLYGTWPARKPPDGKPKKMALPNPRDGGTVEERTKRSPLYYDRALRAGVHDLVLVEGVTDAALAQAKGDRSVVACVAAELSKLQVETLKRRGVKAVTICLDPDSAGDAGIASCIRDLRAAGIVAYVAPRLPDGQDPDDFILANGIDTWKEHAKHAVHAFRWQAQQILAGHSLPPETDTEADAIVREAVAFAAKQPAAADEELLRHYWPEIARATASSVVALQGRAEAARIVTSNGKQLRVDLPTPADWPDLLPIPNDLPPVQPFDLDALLPRAFVSFVSDVATRMQCPVDFPAIALMIVLAGVIGTKIGIRPKRHDDWHVVANLWGAAVGRPGVMKTPAIRGPIKFLQRLEAEAVEQHAAAVGQYELEKEVYVAKKKQRKDTIAQAMKVKDKAKAAEALDAAKQLDPGEEPGEPKPRRFLVNDATVEKLGELLNANLNGLTQFRDELIGFLKSLDREGHEGDRAFYLESWDGGGNYVYDRIGRGTICIENNTLSLIGGITPGKLLDYLRGAIQGGDGDDGLIQRFQLLVYPDVNRQWKNVDRWPETEARRCVWAVMDRLDKIDPATLPGVHYDKDADRRYFRFDDAAQYLFDDWRTRLELRVRSGAEHPAIESHLAKYRSLIPTLALLLHLVDHDGGSVGAPAIQKALAWATYLESHMRRVYSLGIDTASIAAKALAHRILDGKIKDGFRPRDVYRKCWTGLADPQAVTQALDLLVELHWLREEVRKTDGRDAIHYRINPRLKENAPPVGH